VADFENYSFGRRLIDWVLILWRLGILGRLAIRPSGGDREPGSMLHIRGHEGKGIMGSFGFLDPNDIIRGSHLIPGFALGPRPTSPSDPASLWDLEKESDWKTYYVNQ